MKVGGQALTGNADLRFSLYTVAAGGSAIGGQTITFFNKSVAGGLFDVNLDFTQNTFDGLARYLHIEVRYPAGSGVFQVLTPRQQLTPAPMASYALAGNWPWLKDLDNAVFNTGGNVGINTSSPQYPLHVETAAGRAILGRATATTGANYGGYFETESTAGIGVLGYAKNNFGTNYGVWAQAEGDTGRGVFARATSGTGVNYGVYSHTLSNGGTAVYALASANSGSTFGVHAQNQSSSGKGVFAECAATSGQSICFYGTNTSPNGFGLWVAGVSGSRNYLQQDTGIGTNSPSFLLHVNGSAGKPGGGSWSVASDAQLKKNVRPLDHALDSLLALRGVTFEYIDPAATLELPGERIGMIAQEVEAVFPDWVQDNADGYKRLTIRGFEALTVEALRQMRSEQDSKIAEQAQRIDALQGENDALRLRIEAIERAIRDRRN